MRVKSCVASDGGGHTIQLSDEFGCVLRPKMISRFLKARGSDDRATVITYAFFHAFKFPDALSVHIKCKVQKRTLETESRWLDESVRDGFESTLKHVLFLLLCFLFANKVEICRHGCLDHCQLTGSVAHYIQERKDQIRPQYAQSTAASVIPDNDNDNGGADKDNEEAGGGVEHGGDASSLYEDVIQNGDEMASIGGHFLDVEKPIPKAQAQTSERLPPTAAESQHDREVRPDNDDLYLYRSRLWYKRQILPRARKFTSSHAPRCPTNVKMRKRKSGT